MTAPTRNPQDVIDYHQLIADCYAITQQAQGTKGCVQFKAGAERAVSQYCLAPQDAMLRDRSGS